MSIYRCELCDTQKDNDEEIMYYTEKNDSIIIYCETCWDEMDWRFK